MKTILTTISLVLLSFGMHAQNDEVQVIESAFFSHPEYPDIECGDYCVANIMQTDEFGDYIGIYLTDKFLPGTDENKSMTNSINDLFMPAKYEGTYDLNPKYKDTVFKIEVIVQETGDENGTFTMLLLESVSVLKE